MDLHCVKTPNGNQIWRCRSHLRRPYNTQIQQTTKRLRFAEPHTLDEGQEGHSDQSQTAPPCGTETEPPDPKCPQPVRTRIGRTVVNLTTRTIREIDHSFKKKESETLLSCEKYV